jgi:hypothetical protein
MATGKNERGIRMTANTTPIEVLIVAVKETAGSALYGMVDVLLATGNVWETLLRSETARNVFNVHIVSPESHPFTCGIVKGSGGDGAVAERAV